MTKRTYHGSCHCGAVRYEADLDLSAGTGRCNCSICWKKRMWSVGIGPQDFRLIAGEDSLGDYSFGAMQSHHRFCTTCGINLYGHGSMPGMGEYVSVCLSTLDDLEPADLAEAPVIYIDGRGDNWWNPPAETRHL